MYQSDIDAETIDAKYTDAIDATEDIHARQKKEYWGVSDRCSISSTKKFAGEKWNFCNAYVIAEDAPLMVTFIMIMTFMI